jgi:Flp pilus assembly protein TadD
LPDASACLCFVSKGDAERAQGQFEAAITDYDEALSLQPGDSTALSGKDQALHKNREHATWRRLALMYPHPPCYPDGR